MELTTGNYFSSAFYNFGTHSTDSFYNPRCSCIVNPTCFMGVSHRRAVILAWIYRLVDSRLWTWLPILEVGTVENLTDWAVIHSRLNVENDFASIRVKDKHCPVHVTGLPGRIRSQGMALLGSDWKLYHHWPKVWEWILVGVGGCVYKMSQVIETLTNVLE